MLVDAATAAVVAEMAFPRCVQLAFSPRGSYLVAYAQHDAVRNPNGNLCVWNVADLLSAAKTAAAPSAAPAPAASPAAAAGDDTTSSPGLLLRCGQAHWPALFWCADESFVARRAQNALSVYRGSLPAGETHISTVQMPSPTPGKEIAIAVATGPNAEPLISYFLPALRSGPSSVIVARLPNIAEPVINRSIGRGDTAQLQFSCSGRNMTAVITCAVDATGSSYYGSSALHVMSVPNRTSVQVPFGDNEGVHDCQWSPIAEEFIVVHGVMPRNKATLYNGANAQPLYKFAEAPRNTISWAPTGAAFAFAGMGNMAP
jgi:translation initiation factor 2A